MRSACAKSWCARTITLGLSMNMFVWHWLKPAVAEDVGWLGRGLPMPCPRAPLKRLRSAAQRLSEGFLLPVTSLLLFLDLLGYLWLLIKDHCQVTGDTCISRTNSGKCLRVYRLPHPFLGRGQAEHKHCLKLPLCFTSSFYFIYF